MKDLAGYYVYVLEGETGAYIGQTADMVKRLAEHKRGKCNSSAKLGQLSLAYWWNPATRYLALKLEVYLQHVQRKHGDSHIWELVIDRARLSDLLAAAMLRPDTAYQLAYKTE